LIDALVTDAQRLLQRLGDGDFDGLRAERALVARQDVEPGRTYVGTGTGCIARRMATDRVISVHDPDTRHVHKAVRQPNGGYKAMWRSKSTRG
jgi:hypothetical protein